MLLAARRSRRPRRACRAAAGRGSRGDRRRRGRRRSRRLEAELAVLEDPVGDHAAEVAGAGDQDALEADAGAPAALEQPRARTRATRTSSDDVADEEERPDELRDLEGADVLERVAARSRPGRTACRRRRGRPRGCCRRRRRRSRRRASGRAAAGRGPGAGTPSGTSTPMNGSDVEVLLERRMALA